LASNVSGRRESAQPPKVADVFRRGSRVEVRTWGGKVLYGVVCDRETDGLLLDVRRDGAASGEYVFLPWSSVEQVAAVGITERTVKSLPL
jgi:hypothetical protein